MNSIKKNIVANFIGRIWSGLIMIILIPLYVKYLGIESYGLVGFYTTLISSLAVLDLGLSTTLNRELARFKSENRSANDIRNLTFSFECIYWSIGFLICLVVVLLAQFIAVHWLKTEHLPLATVKNSVMLIGAVIAFQWPISLYSGGLTGLEKQVLNNVIIVIMTTIRAAGVIIILKYFSPTISAFFIWQGITSLLYVLVIRWGLWRKLPTHHKLPKFSMEQIKMIWRFAIGMTGISFVTFFLGQVDKIILSKILPLSLFGYYMLAFSMSSTILMIVAPLSIGFFPRFTALIAAKEQEALIKLYHQACKLMTACICPVGFILLFFTKDILRIWTHNAVTTENTYLIAQMLVVGMILNALMVLPFNLMTAMGWTKFTFYQNLIAAIILIPLLLWLTNIYGSIGAAYVWLIINAGVVLISQPLMHRKILNNELRKWYLNDTLYTLIPSLFLTIVIKFSLNEFLPHVQINLVILCLISFVVVAFSFLSMPDVRTLIKKIF